MRTSQSAFWASWADCLLMVHPRHAPVAGAREALVFLRLLARAKARSEPLMRMRAQQAWKFRWLSILACASARAVAVSLLGLYEAIAVLMV